jgi:lipopolysaccharide transport system permease protein
LKQESSALTVIGPAGASMRTHLLEHWNARPLFFQLAMRDLRLRYRHTFLGAGWALLQPLLPMLIFAAVFSRLRLDTGGTPYALFVFSGFAPWIFIGNAVAGASPTFLNNFDMINKIYFPRAVLPLAVVAALALDGAVAALAVFGVSWWYGYGPVWSWLVVPAVGVAAIMVAMAAAVIAASLTTLLRDLKNVVPFLVQLWMYASPVLYPVASMPPAVQRWAGLNPVAGVLEAFRASLFGTAPSWGLLAQSAVATVLLIGAALWLFQYLDADLAERV